MESDADSVISENDSLSDSEQMEVTRIERWLKSSSSKKYVPKTRHSKRRSTNIEPKINVETKRRFQDKIRDLKEKEEILNREINSVFKMLEPKTEAELHNGISALGLVLNGIVANPELYNPMPATPSSEGHSVSGTSSSASNSSGFFSGKITGLIRNTGLQQESNPTDTRAFVTRK